MGIIKFIDKCALYDLHRKRSKKSQYISSSNVSEGVNDIEDFYSSSLIDVHFNQVGAKVGDYFVNKFEYKSLIESRESTNNTVVGEAFLTNNDDVPNIIFVHGWRMDSNDRIKKIYHQQIKDLGWNMYYFTLPYHFDRMPESSLFSGEYMLSADIDRTVEASQQAVVDLRALITWIKSNKKGPVIVIGVSLGGFVTNLTALVEPQIDVLVSVFYANRLSYSIWETNPGKYIKIDLEENGVTYSDLIDSWKITEPSQALPRMNKDNILLISAKHDQYVHMEDTSFLWESWDKPRRYIYDCGHAGIVLNRKKIAKDTIDFIRNRLDM